MFTTARSHALIGALRDGILLVGSDLRVVEVNDRMCEMTGYAEHEWIGATAPYPSWPEDGAARLASLLGEAIASGSRRYDVRLVEFVQDLVHNRASRHVVRAVVSLARDFGHRTIAEGAEDHETLGLLRKLSVDFAQGYGIGRPAPLDHMCRIRTQERQVKA